MPSRQVGALTIKTLFHLRRMQDLRLVVLIAISLVLIGLHLDEVGQGRSESGSGWRQVDLDALQRRIEAGDLSDREADWYRPAEEQQIER